MLPRLINSSHSACRPQDPKVPAALPSCSRWCVAPGVIPPQRQDFAPPFVKLLGVPLRVSPAGRGPPPEEQHTHPANHPPPPQRAEGGLRPLPCHRRYRAAPGWSHTDLAALQAAAAEAQHVSPLPSASKIRATPNTRRLPGPAARLSLRPSPQTAREGTLSHAPPAAPGPPLPTPAALPHRASKTSPVPRAPPSWGERASGSGGEIGRAHV